MYQQNVHFVLQMEMYMKMQLTKSWVVGTFQMYLRNVDCIVHEYVVIYLIWTCTWNVNNVVY